jgi:hypothetical protein
VTELLQGVAEVRVDEPAGTLRAVRFAGRWRTVSRVANRWVVETDWWRTPVRRLYLRLLLGEAECIELYRDLDSGIWYWSRRYD